MPDTRLEPNVLPGRVPCGNVFAQTLATSTSATLMMPLRVVLTRTVLVAVLASTAVLPDALRAQAAPSPIRPPSVDSTPRPTANPADVASVDAILRSLYDVISGPAGQKRDWDRFRSLMAPNARLMPAVVRPDGSASLIVWSADDYVTAAGAQLERMGFFESEVARKAEAFGNIVHAFSTYDSRRLATDDKPFARGINSIQLLKDGGRWWVVSIFWDSERAGNPIPEKYLR